MKKELLEKIVFEKFKDYCFMNAEDFKKTVAKYNINATKVWVYITKHQVSKYGTTLIGRHCKCGRYTPKKRRV